MAEPLLGGFAGPGDREAVVVAGESLTYRELARAAGGLAARLGGVRTAAVVATPSLDTIVGIVGALAAGTVVVPVSPGAGTLELEHFVADSEPEVVVGDVGADLPPALRGRPLISTRGEGAEYGERDDLDPEATAFVLYTSGTTGLPKGVQLPRRAIATNLDALADVWGWTVADRLTHGLPLFHVHGLVLGVLGPLRLGGQLEHHGRFSPGALAGALERGATMAFGVPTMYHRVADEAEKDPAIARALARARLLVSGSAALPALEHRRIERLCDQRIVERYGMTETLMNASVRVDGERRAGYVGLPLPGVELRLLADDGTVIEVSDDETMGEIAVRGPNVFTGYINRPDATAEALRDGWFRTGDLATRAPDGYIRIVGRRSTDLIKSGGYRIGAGEIEGALLEHPGVAEVAVTGEPDPDLGERIVAWVVPREGASPSAEELVAHASGLLSAHKRPREVRFLEQLPRNPMGKVTKQALRAPAD